MTCAVTLESLSVAVCLSDAYVCMQLLQGGAFRQLLEQHVGGTQVAVKDAAGTEEWVRRKHRRKKRMVICT